MLPVLIALVLTSFFTLIAHAEITGSTSIRLSYFDPVWVTIPYEVTWTRGSSSDPTTFFLQTYAIGNSVPTLPQDTVFVDTKGATSGKVTFMQCVPSRRGFRVLDAKSTQTVIYESNQYSVKQADGPAPQCPSTTANQGPTNQPPPPPPTNTQGNTNGKGQPPTTNGDSDTKVPNNLVGATNSGSTTANPTSGVSKDSGSTPTFTPAADSLQTNTSPSDNTSHSSNPSTASAAAAAASSSGGLSKGVTAAIVIIVLALLLGLILAFFLYRRHRRKREEAASYDTSAMIKHREAYGDPYPGPYTRTSQTSQQRANEAALLQRIADLENAMQHSATVTTDQLAQLRNAIGELRDDPYSVFGSDITPGAQPPAYFPNRTSANM